MNSKEMFDICKKEMSFCQNEPVVWKIDDEYILERIKTGRKRAFSYAKEVFEAQGNELKEEGSFVVITDSNDEAVCVVKMDKVYEFPFILVRLSHAYLEGDSDRMLTSWRAKYSDLFTKQLSEIGKEFSDQTPVICEEFTVVYGKEI